MVLTVPSSKELVALATRVLDIESRAVVELVSRLDDTFADACRLCLETDGRVIVTGMGKSGHAVIFRSSWRSQSRRSGHDYTARFVARRVLLR